MLEIEKQQMCEFLQNQDNRRYIDVLTTVNMLSERAKIHINYYINNDDFIIEINNDYHFYLTCDENIKFLYELSRDKKPFFCSYDEKIYTNSAFIKRFGVFEPVISRYYGLFNKIRHEIVLPETDEIRQLATVEDFDMADKFAEENEQHGLPTYEVTNFTEFFRKGKTEHHRMYGYFRNNILAAFVTATDFRKTVCHIAFIYTSPKYRHNNIALNLAKHFINEFIEKDIFISYGYAINEASAKTALAAGFELFTTTYDYSTSW